jgi:hypothetical protein
MHSIFCSNFRGGLGRPFVLRELVAGCGQGRLRVPVRDFRVFAEVSLLRAQAWGTEGTVLGCLLLS